MRIYTQYELNRPYIYMYLGYLWVLVDAIGNITIITFPNVLPAWLRLLLFPKNYSNCSHSREACLYVTNSSAIPPTVEKKASAPRYFIFSIYSANGSRHKRSTAWELLLIRVGNVNRYAFFFESNSQFNDSFKLPFSLASGALFKVK